MTEDSDFKQIIRDRAAKTGESYQTARRILERKRGQFSALANSTFDKPAGRVLGCIIEDGKVTRGMKVTVTTPEGVKHQGVVVSLRHMWDDVDSVSYGEFGEFGLLLEPAYLGPIPAQVTANRHLAGRTTECRSSHPVVRRANSQRARARPIGVCRGLDDVLRAGDDRRRGWMPANLGCICRRQVYCRRPQRRAARTEPHREPTPRHRPRTLTAVIALVVVVAASVVVKVAASRCSRCDNHSHARRQSPLRANGHRRGLGLLLHPTIVAQCATPVVDPAQDCDLLFGFVMRPPTDGTFIWEYHVSRFINPPRGAVDCGAFAGACAIGAGETNDGANNVWRAFHPISFVEAIVPGIGAVIEGNVGTANLEVPVSAFVSPLPKTVQWKTVVVPGASIGQADPATDYTSASGTVTFAPAETRKVVTIAVTGDTAEERDEHIVIQFGNPTGAVMGGFWGLGFGTITNDTRCPWSFRVPRRTSKATAAIFRTSSMCQCISRSRRHASCPSTSVTVLRARRAGIAS